MTPPAALNPGIFHGLIKKPPFFEGWYYKLVSADEKHKLAIIPGVILGQDAHAFVQVLDGVEGTAAYVNFPLQDFHGDAERFSVKIGANQFDGQHLKVNLDDPECQLSGEITLGAFNPWPVTWLLPGVMGWFAWVPGMECYHGVLSFDHSLQGKLILNGKEMDFSGGRGYMEKDWGKNFPAAWVWLQSNHFQNQRACITASVALIPWMGATFKGFIVGFWLEGKLHRFTTYLNSKIEALDIFDTHVTWALRNRTHRLRLNAYRAEGSALRGPTHLDMGKRVIETLNASIHVRLETLQGEVLFDSTGENAGLEVVGDLQRLIVSKS